MTEEKKSDSQEAKSNEVKKNPLKETFESLKKNEKLESVYKYASTNTRDTIAYLLMIIGIVLLFTHSFYGGSIVGIVFGLYFASEISQFIQSVNDLIEEQGMVRSLVFGLLLLALFISAPAVFIGAALAVGIKQILFA